MNKLIITLYLFFLALTAFAQEVAPPSISSCANGHVSAEWKGQKATLKPGEAIGPWTLMSVLANSKPSPMAVFENFTDRNGQMVFVDKNGVQRTFGKSAEATFPTDSSKLYNGHTLMEVLKNPVDILGKEILAKSGDPTYDAVAPLLEPFIDGHFFAETYTFVGTPANHEKLPIRYGGIPETYNTSNLFRYFPETKNIISAHKVWDGLVGGWLPALRYIYPKENGDWIEQVIFAPFRMENENNRKQPVWYRISYISGGRLASVRYIDSYVLPASMQNKPDPASFYNDLSAFEDGWDHELKGAMEVSLPDRRLQDMSRQSLARLRMTRQGINPQYGVADKPYGQMCYEGFQDIFNAETITMSEWGLSGTSRSYIENFLDKWVRDDGMLLFYGPQMGQYGRMLTNIAQYVSYTGDYNLLLKYRTRLDGIARLLLNRREESLKLDPSDPRRGLIFGFSEADACMWPNSERYDVPYFGNSTEIARGWRDLGRVWQKVADPERQNWGSKLIEHSVALEKDIQLSIERSIIKNTTPACIPPIAGGQPFDAEVAKDIFAPEMHADRSYVEMLYSGNLTREQVKMVVDYRATHNDMILGMPSIVSRSPRQIPSDKSLDGYVLYMHAYGLLQHDFIREYLLMLNGMMAHHYTRGSWTAVEVRNIDPQTFSNGYASPAQAVVPLMARWLLVFEDPQSGDLWLAKAAPRDWLADGQHFLVKDAPTRHGKISYTVTSAINKGKIEINLELPAKPVDAPIHIRLRAPEGHTLKAVSVDGKPYKNFDAAAETITLQAGASGVKNMVVNYK